MLPLIPLLVALSAAPRGGVAPSGQGPEPFAATSTAPSDVDLFLSIAHAARAREIVGDRPFGAAMEALVADLAVGDAWQSFVRDLADATQGAGERGRASAPGRGDQGAIFDMLFGEQMTVLARDSRDGAGLAGAMSNSSGAGMEASDGLEWAVLSTVDHLRVAALLEELSPRISLGGWRTLVGHDLAYLLDGDLMIVAPAERRGLAESVIELRRRGGPRLAGIEAVAAARSLESPASGEPLAHADRNRPRVELLLRHPRQAESAEGWTAAVLDLGTDGTLSIRHRSTFEQPQFNPVPLRNVDLTAMRALAGKASIVIIEPLTLEGAHPDPAKGAFVALSPDARRGADLPGAPPEWTRSIIEQLALLDSTRRDPLWPWMGTAGAPRVVLDRASMQSAIGEWARGSAVRSLLSVPAMMISWKPAEGLEPEPPARIAAGQSAAATGPHDRKAPAPAGSAILFEIGRGEAAVADQQEALAEQAKRRLGGGPPRRQALPGEFPGGSAVAGRSGGASGAKVQSMRLVRTADGDVQVVGSDAALVESLAGQLVKTGPGADDSMPLRSAGFMHGHTLARELAGLVGGPAGALARLAEGVEAIEWRILQPDTHTIEIEATATLAPLAR